MAAASPLLGVDSALFNTYLFWSAVLIVKVVMMAFLTGRQRMKKHIFANPEDAKSHSGKVKFDDPDVERVRRAHQNDLENIVPFLLICPLYLTTGPSVWLAANLIRAFACARILHSICYLNELRLRGACFGVGVLVIMFMAGSTIMFACPWA